MFWGIIILPSVAVPGDLLWSDIFPGEGEITGRETHFQPFLPLCLFTLDPVALSSGSHHGEKTKGRWKESGICVDTNFPSNVGDRRGVRVGEHWVFASLGCQRETEGGLPDEGDLLKTKQNIHGGLQQLEVLDTKLGATWLYVPRPTEVLSGQPCSRGGVSKLTCEAGGRRASFPEPEAWALRREYKASHRRHLTCSSSHTTPGSSNT